MTITELISRLEEIKEEYGDLVVFGDDLLTVELETFVLEKLEK